jgi:ATP-dependent Lhr-like helicase
MDFALPNGIAFADLASPATSLATLPDSIARWFLSRFGEPTAAQRLAWPSVAAGRNLLVSAPTGTGKTLAAFLPILTRLLSEHCESSTPWSVLTQGVRCLYVAPLKALGNDTCRNLESIAAELSAVTRAGPLRVAVRTGDTSEQARRILNE